MVKNIKKSKKIKEKTEVENNKSNMSTRITAEYNKLSKLFKSDSADKNHVIKKLVKRAAFLMVLSEDMERDIRESELKTTTINASQTFVKSNPLLKDYRDTVKSYQTVLKQLCDLVKDGNSNNKEIPDELEAFLKT